MIREEIKHKIGGNAMEFVSTHRPGLSQIRKAELIDMLKDFAIKQVESQLQAKEQQLSEAVEFLNDIKGKIESQLIGEKGYYDTEIIDKYKE